MLLTDSQIKLKSKLQELDRQFQECSSQCNWMGCLAAIKKQNRLLGLCAIESKSNEDEDIQENFDDGIALLLAIRIVSPATYNSIIHKILIHD